MREDFADILPYQFIQLVSRDEARRTLFIATGDNGVSLASAGVVSIAGMTGATGTGQMAQAATDQCP